MTLEQALSDLEDPDPRVHLRAIRWLRVIGGPQAVVALIDALERPSADLRCRAARALGEMKAREAVPALIERSLAKSLAVTSEAFVPLEKLRCKRILGVHPSGLIVTSCGLPAVPKPAGWARGPYASR